jgi:hypothetical protein
MKNCVYGRTQFYFYFLRLWACGLALLFFGLWVFCGSSFFLKGTVGCSNCWIGQFGKKELSGRAERMWKRPCTSTSQRSGRTAVRATFCSWADEIVCICGGLLSSAEAILAETVWLQSKSTNTCIYAPHCLPALAELHKNLFPTQFFLPFPQAPSLASDP